MKLRNIRILWVPLFLLFAFDAHAAAISYTIINTVGTSTIHVTVNELSQKREYDCSLSDFSCSPAKEIVVPYATSSSKTVTKDEALALLAEKPKKPEPPVATIFDSNPRLPLKSIPNDAKYITPLASSTKTAFYTTNGGGYSITSSRTYWLFDTETHDTSFFVEKVPVGWDLISDMYHVFSWSPDGKHLIYASDRSGHQSLYLVRVSGKTASVNLKGKQLIAGDYTVADFVVGTSSVFFIANREESHTWNLYELPFTKKVPDVLDTHVMYTNELVMKDGVILYTKDVDGKGILKGYDTASKKPVAFKGMGYGDLLVGASKILTRPFKGIVLPTTKSTDTALIWLHGGPYRQTAATRHSYGSYALYDWMLELLRKEGVMIVKSDYPGSYGFGVNYAHSLVGNIGKKDMQEIKVIVGHLKEQGIKHIYIAGVSYGGYLTLKAIDDLPKTFTGAVAIAPVTDWKKLLTDVYPSPFEVDFQAKTQGVKNRLFAKSATLAARERNTTPTLLIHGDNDTTVPDTQSLHYIARSDGNVSVSMTRLLGEKHVLAGPAQIEETCRAFSAILKRNIKCDLTR